MRQNPRSNDPGRHTAGTDEPTPASATVRSDGPAVGVLIVEDDGLVAKDLARALVRLGYHVIGRAATGEDGARLAKLFEPRLILMDINLRGRLDGIATAKLIGERSNTPIVFLTALSDKQTLGRAMQVQPFGYIVKPFDEVELHCAIEVALNRHRTENAVRVSEQAYRHLSSIDELTALPNRRGFCDLAEQQMKVARRYQQPLVLCFVDLDGLKQINDTLGHSAGDDAIRAAAHVLRETFRGADIVARLSGDEFAVLAIANSQSSLDSALHRLSDHLERFNAAAPPFTLAMSVGMVHHDMAREECLADLLCRADAAMYAEKQRKRSNPAMMAHREPASMRPE